VRSRRATGRGDRSTIASAPQASRRGRAGRCSRRSSGPGSSTTIAWLRRGPRCSPSAIRFDLERQGLDDESVAAALARLEPERQRARRLVEQRGGGARTARWLAQRGFDAGAVEDALGRFAEEV
jgi:hypothetical protein